MQRAVTTSGVLLLSWANGKGFRQERNFQKNAIKFFLCGAEGGGGGEDLRVRGLAPARYAITVRKSRIFSRRLNTGTSSSVSRDPMDRYGSTVQLTSVKGFAVTQQHSEKIHLCGRKSKRKHPHRQTSFDCAMGYRRSRFAWTESRTSARLRLLKVIKL